MDSNKITGKVKEQLESDGNKALKVQNIICDIYNKGKKDVQIKS